MKISNALLVLCSLCLMLGGAFSQQCHYSCSTCTMPFHQYCKSCNTGFDLRVVKNPNQIPIQLRDTRVITGVCSNQPQLPTPNVLGIIIIVSAAVFITATGSKLLFYIASTMQSLSLLYFLEIGWLMPVSYILNALQYLMPCNIIIRDTKQSGWQISITSFNQVDQYFGEPQLQKSFLLLGSLNLVVIILLALLHVARVLKKKYFADKCRSIICFNEWAIDYEIGFLNCIFYFLIQQTILSFVVAFQFTKPNGFLIGCAVAYSISFFLFTLQLFRFKITLFYNSLSQFYEIIKKIVYPIFIVVPFQYQFFLIVYMGINCSLQALFDYKVKSYIFKSQNTIFKALEALTILFFGIFYGVDSSAKDIGPPLAMSRALTVVMCLLMLVYFVEIPLAIKSKLSKSNKEENKVNQSNQSKTLVPQISILGRDQNMTLGLSSTKRQQRRQVTEGQLIERNDSRKLSKLSESIDEPPVIDRQNTKDSFQKSKKSDPENLHVQPIVQEYEPSNQVDQPRAVQLGVKHEHEKPGKKKNKDQLKTELKKRYGV